MDIIVGNVSYTDVAPLMTSASAPAPYKAQCSINCVEQFWKCLDGNTKTMFRTNISTACPFTASLDMGEGNSVAISAYKLDCTYNPAWSMKDWQFEGSNDGATWDVLDTRSNITWSTENIQLFKTNNTKAYRYYRFNVLAKNGTNSVCINELSLLKENPTPIEFRKVKEANLPDKKEDGTDTVYITDTGKMFITDKEGKIRAIGGAPAIYADNADKILLASNLWADEDSIRPIKDQDTDLVSVKILQDTIRSNNTFTQNYISSQISIATEEDCTDLINNLNDMLTKKE